MAKVLERGFTWWDRSLIPRDELEERAKAAQRRMAEAGLDVLTVWSSYYHTVGQTAFLAGWPIGGAVVLFPDGEPILFSPGGTREHHFTSVQIWCEMRSTPGGVVQAVAKAIAERSLTRGRIGVVGADQIDVGPYATLLQSFADFELVAFDEAYAALRAPKRPRERLAIARSHDIAARSVAEAQSAFAAGASNAAALAEAERVGRLLGARDFRGLANIGGKALRPYEGLDDARYGPLTLWVAVEQHGYWATASSDPGDGQARQALQAMIAAVRPGVAAGVIAAEGLARLSPEARASALSYGLGGGIGLDLEEGPAIAPDNAQALRRDMILSLQVVAPGEPFGLASAMVRVGPDGPEALS